MSAPSTGRTGREGWQFILLVTLSGLAALVYQVAWTRRLTLLFGASTYALATVLAVFLGGLALGAWLLGGPLDRCRRPLRAYAWLEGGIGLYALVFPLLLDGAEAAYLGLARGSSASVALHTAVRAVLATGLLLPPTFLMGGTLPAMCRVFLRREESLGRDLGLLYACNTLGAALGALLSGFVLLAWLGLSGTLLFAAAVNLSLAGAALLLSRRQVDRPEVEALEPDVSLPAVPVPVWVVLGASAVSGLTALGCEVLWVRALVTVLHTGFTYALSLMLATFLIGLVLGSLIYARFLSRTADLRTFSRAQCLIGLWGLLSIWLLGKAPFLERLAVQRGWLGAEYTWSSWIAEVAVASALVMLVPTTLMGIGFPLAARLVAGNRRQFGRRIGLLYAWNTLGSILGSLGAGFLLVPLVGTLNALLLLALANLVLGAALAWLSPAANWERLAVSAVVASLVVGGLLVTPQNYFGESLARWRGGKLLYFEEDVIGVVEIYHQPSPSGDFYRRLFVNGTSYASTSHYARRYHKLLGHLPALLHPAPERTLVIAFGTGMTAGALTRYDAVRTVECVDLSAAVIGGAPQFAEANGSVLDDPKTRVFLEDGRAHLLLDDEGYDLITLEPPPPRFAGVANLYSREFYELSRSRLRPGGVAAQWIPMHSHTEEEMRMLVRAFVEAFPNSTLWLPVQRDAILIGSVEPMSLDLAAIARRMSEPDVAADLRDVDVEHPAALAATLLLDAEGLREYVRGVQPITDDLPAIEYFAGRPLAEAPVHLERLLRYAMPLARVQAALASGDAGPALGEELVRQHQALHHYFRGAVLGDRLDRRGQALEWRKAQLAAPESAFFRRLGDQLPLVRTIMAP